MAAIIRVGVVVPLFDEAGARLSSRRVSRRAPRRRPPGDRRRPPARLAACGGYGGSGPAQLALAILLALADSETAQRFHQRCLVHDLAASRWCRIELLTAIDASLSKAAVAGVRPVPRSPLDPALVLPSAGN